MMMKLCSTEASVIRNVLLERGMLLSTVSTSRENLKNRSLCLHTIRVVEKDSKFSKETKQESNSASKKVTMLVRK